MANIIYTYTDEAPALATHSLLPVIQSYARAADVAVDLWDISLAGRILAVFPDRLRDDQGVQDALTDLGAHTQDPDANIIKLPNISASLPQLKAAIAELQAKGYDVPDYPDDPKSDADHEVVRRYDRVKGSAVNPVLREGNSDRRAPAAVKNFARAYPHSMGEWSSDSASHVATMSEGDFRSSERSTTVEHATTVRIEHVAADGATRVLKDGLDLQAAEVIDAAVMRRAALLDFLAAEIEDARAKGVLFSIHLKATMMKVSDPIIFGHAVRTFFAEVFDRYADALARVGVNPNNGLASLEAAIAELPAETREAILADIQVRYDEGPELAQVDSNRGITNLHVPSDVIIDASIPAMIRSSGKMWNRADELQDVKAVIPDSSYAAIYGETIEFCKLHGAFDPATMGSVSNVGLMAQKAEEYGSHDKTFEIDAPGTVRVVDVDGDTLLEHEVATGDIWRMCQTKDAAIRDWVKLAISRARATGVPTVFWLDADRAHDAQLIAKVERELANHDTDGLDLRIMNVRDAVRLSLQRAHDGLDTVSVTGNVLRDYLTDLFPILELGTSAKMLSVVPLMNGGAMFETGAGGSAPKHVQQFVKENHLRWDSLGEFLALAASFEHFANAHGHRPAKVLADTLDAATATLLNNGKSPSRKVGELDNRGSHFYLALYWAQALATQTEDGALAKRFTPIAEALASKEAAIVNELNRVQGPPVDLDGYYWIDRQRADAAMRPSATLNAVLDEVATAG
ncbi:MAG: NADP-dependent isocitrate dehydrogenase [Nitriliruptoraceae bacterium]